MHSIFLYLHSRTKFIFKFNAKLYVQVVVVFYRVLCALFSKKIMLKYCLYTILGR